jgi:hypothetical protein
MVDGLKLVKWAIGASTGVGGSKRPLSNSTVNDPKTFYTTNTYKHKDLECPHEQKACSAGFATENPVPPAPNHPPSPLCGGEAFFGERGTARTKTTHLCGTRIPCKKPRENHVPDACRGSSTRCWTRRGQAELRRGCTLRFWCPQCILGLVGARELSGKAQSNLFLSSPYAT